VLERQQCDKKPVMSGRRCKLRRLATMLALLLAALAVGRPIAALAAPAAPRCCCCPAESVQLPADPGPTMAARCDCSVRPSDAHSTSPQVTSAEPPRAGLLAGIGLPAFHSLAPPPPSASNYASRIAGHDPPASHVPRYTLLCSRLI
jgi:hypothetical protein